MITVKLTRGYEALIDADELHLLENLWCVSHPETGRPYAVRRGKYGRLIYMHREVCQPRPRKDQDVDHINGNTLDNRKANLRPVSRSRNNLNRRTSHGVSYVTRTGKWYSYINVEGKRHHLGYFDTEEMALWARRNAEERLIP